MLNRYEKELIAYSLDKGHGAIAYIDCNKWLDDFVMSFQNYGNSIFENVIAKLNVDCNYSKIYKFVLASRQGTQVNFLEQIEWNFNNNVFYYMDEFNNKVIDTDNFVTFIEELELLHPGFDIPRP